MNQTLVTGNQRFVQTATPGISDVALYQALLESTMAIPWKIDFASKRFNYIGPQIELLLGWPRDSWVSVDDWVSKIHPDDRGHQVIDLCRTSGGIALHHEADYRIHTVMGDYVWIRDVVHVVHGNDGAIDSLIGFMFDITERKKIERELVEMKQRLEELSYEDGLTGVANRRRLDDGLAAAWASAAASGQTLSLILLDIDEFKQFNDHYGHVDGDACLVRVGQALKAALGHGGTIVARYGGEEFALLLPQGDMADALQLAEAAQRTIAGLAIAHDRSSCSDRLTASFGAGTVRPRPSSGPEAFLRAVDQMLYQAKAAGRNNIVAARIG